MKTIIKIFLICLLIALLALGLISCGARKVNKEQTKEEIKSEVLDNSITEKLSESNINKTTKVIADDKNETTIKEVIYEWGDSGVYLTPYSETNHKIPIRKIIREYTQKNNTQTESKSDIVEKQNTTSKEQKAVINTNTTKKETKSKQVEKKQFNPFFLMCIFALGLILLWCVYRFYKKLPLVPKL